MRKNIKKKNEGSMRYFSTLSLFNTENRPTYVNFGKHYRSGNFPEKVTLPEIVLNWLTGIQKN